MLQMEIDEIIEGIAEAKKIQGSRFTVKQMERAKKSLETRLKRLHDQSRKDDMITFEELGRILIAVSFVMFVIAGLFEVSVGLLLGVAVRCV